MTMSTINQNLCGSTSRVHFRDEDRYATDCGSQCSRECAADGETFWVYIVEHPFREALGQCATCHEILRFSLCRSDDGAIERPTIAEVMTSHCRFLADVSSSSRMSRLDGEINEKTT